MRNLTKTLAVISLLAPTSGYSLGIGNIKLHSVLNQNLNAEISLVLSAGEKASDIKVSLAAPDKFDAAGVPWASFLSRIKFATVVGVNGSVVIKLSSNEAVKEPFLDFLIEVSWPKGSLYREFTVLVDPPDGYKQATIPIVTSYNSYEPQQEIVPRTQVLQRQRTGTENNTGAASEYGPTRRNDTLWKIAERAGRQEDVSVEQMMIAVYKENPRAFYQENMNALLIGKMLKIPDREVVLKFSRKQAMAELNRQTTAWKDRLTQTPIETASAKKDTVDNQLTLIAPAETAISEKVQVAPEIEQTTTKKTATDGTTEIADQDNGVASPGDDALQAKIEELEKKLATMQQIIALKDQQLAAMQNQSQEKPGIQPQVIQPVPSQAEPPAPVVQQQSSHAAVKPPIQPESEAEVFLDPYFLWVGGIGTGILSLLGWVWWRKHKIDEETDFVASNIGTIVESKGIASPSLNKNSAAYDADVAGKSSFISEVSFADLDTFDTDQSEIDPLSEADVYLAYGRYQQAEELMRETLKNQPDRDECKLKLLEIIYSRKNKQAFEAYASELAETGKKDDVEFWAKVTEMGTEICPDSILFASGADQFSDERNTFFDKNHANVSELNWVKTETVMDTKKVDFGLTAFDDVFWKAQEVAGKDEFESLDFELSAKATKEKEIDKIDLNGANGFNEDYQSIDFSNDKPAGLSDSASNDPLEGDFEFDFDMSVGELYGQDSELTDRDELETKLDLAMAYIDMNDSDAAKDIAREVLDKGTPEQQLTAQTLLDRLK